MKTNRDRQIHYTLFSTPTPGEDGYEEFVKEADERIASNPKLKKKLKKNRKEVLRIARTQSQNGIGQLVDRELRYFHVEFNTRIWRFGFGARNMAFNVLEAFFKWSPNLFYFELIEEVEHLFSFFDFIDFVTSKNCTKSLKLLNESIESDLIYTYNVLNNVKDISFKTKDSKDYYIGGVSFVKRDNEISMLIIAGEKGDIDELTKYLPDLKSMTSKKPYLEPAPDRKREAVKLLDIEDLWKVNIYVRIDLKENKIDCRYIQKDAGDSFTTFTDDVGVFGKRIETQTDFDELMANQLKEVNNYEAIFEVAYNCLFLPEYFDYYDDSVLPEEHPTGLYNETKSRSPLKGNNDFEPSYFFKTRDVWVLDRNNLNVPKETILSRTELKIEKDGYWEYLEPGKIGVSKDGSPIHNRTWVEKTLSWRETPNNSEVKAKVPNTKSQNQGYIYILRNPAHEIDILKIGLTTKTVEERAGQLSGTPSPDKFLIIHRWPVTDCVLAETTIHEKLDKYRVNPKREFFKIDLELAISVISPIIKEINAANEPTETGK
jgi:hypothetical protein